MFYIVVSLQTKTRPGQFPLEPFTLSSDSCLFSGLPFRDKQPVLVNNSHGQWWAKF